MLTLKKWQKQIEETNNYYIFGNDIQSVEAAALLSAKYPKKFVNLVVKNNKILPNFPEEV